MHIAAESIPTATIQINGRPASDYLGVMMSNTS
jgi:hypothetical protein